MRSYFNWLDKKRKPAKLMLRIIKSKRRFNAFFWIILGSNSNFTLDFIRLGFYRHKGVRKFCFIWIEELMNWLYFGAKITYRLKRLLFFINLFKSDSKFFSFFTKKSFFFLDSNWVFLDFFIFKYLEYENHKVAGGNITFKEFLNLN